MISPLFSLFPEHLVFKYNLRLLLKLFFYLALVLLFMPDIHKILEDYVYM